MPGVPFSGFDPAFSPRCPKCDNPSVHFQRTRHPYMWGRDDLQAHCYVCGTVKYGEKALRQVFEPQHAHWQQRQREAELEKQRQREAELEKQRQREAELAQVGARKNTPPRCRDNKLRKAFLSRKALYETRTTAESA